MVTEISLELLGETVVEVLQDAAFVFAEPMESDTGAAEQVLVARMGFNGPTSGEIFFSCSEALATDFAANLLGVEPDDPNATALRQDAVGEMLNILCGAFLARWFGIDGAFEMGIPSVAKSRPDEWEHDKNNAALMLPFVTDDGYRLEIGIVS